MIIAPWTLDSFKERALQLGISEFDLVEVYRAGCETIDRRKRIYRGNQFTTDFSPRLRIDFVLSDDDVQKTLHSLMRLVHPESLAVFRLHEKVRTIPSTTHDPHNSFLPGELATPAGQLR